MGWQTLTPTSGKNSASALVSVTMNAGNGSGVGKRKRYITVMFRAGMLNAPWLEKDQRVVVQLGTGDKAGMLRIVPALKAPGFFVMQGVGVNAMAAGGGAMKNSAIKIPAPAGLAAVGAVSRTICDYEMLDGEVIITLPPAVVPGAATSVTGKQPYKMNIPSHAEWLDEKGGK